ASNCGCAWRAPRGLEAAGGLPICRAGSGRHFHGQHAVHRARTDRHGAGAAAAGATEPCPAAAEARAPRRPAPRRLTARAGRAKRARMHGWLILDKPVGLGSTQAVGAVKRALREGGYPKTKVGHGGTLDPLASGVLPVALGEATKLSGRMLDSDKTYEFTIAFGSETDTLDAEGGITETSDRRPTAAEIEAVLPRFTGAIEQR